MPGRLHPKQQNQTGNIQIYSFLHGLQCWLNTTLVERSKSPHVKNVYTLNDTALNFKMYMLQNIYHKDQIMTTISDVKKANKTCGGVKLALYLSAYLISSLSSILISF